MDRYVRLEKQGKQGAKFWMAEKTGLSVRYAFGGAGTQGTSREEAFATEEAAQAEYAARVNAKRSDGYTERGRKGDVGALEAIRDELGARPGDRSAMR
jgi:predicted DNA-binding WGR domain protein